MHAGTAIFSTLLCALCLASAVRAESGTPSRSFLVDLNNLDLARQLWQAGDPRTATDMNNLLINADAYLNVEPPSVVNSAIMAPSGDPHDYAGYAAYWWPNPDTENGLPWIRRDGHINTANYEDFALLQDLSRYSEALSFAYYVTGEEKYAEKTAQLLRTWFLDEATYMNPRNEYSHLLPGATIGLYDVPGFANRFPTILDAAGIIESSPAWTAQDKAGLEAWTSSLLTWAKESPLGFKQFIEPSNHGTNYDFFHALLALYHGNDDEALSNVRQYFIVRMPGQYAADGSNPLEMARANNLLYHRYNLGRALELAALGRHVGFDGFQYTTQDGRGLRLALDYLIPYMTGEKIWDMFPGEVFPKELDAYYGLIVTAADFFRDPELLEIAETMPIRRYGFVNLTHPAEAVRRSGDFDGDRLHTVLDLDALSRQVRTGDGGSLYDLNYDGSVDQQDRYVWLNDLAQIPLGDSDMSGRFDSGDLVNIMAFGLYEDDIPLNASWASGDWNGDGDFTSGDWVTVMLVGSFEKEAAVMVAEPYTGRDMVIALAWLLGWFGNRSRIKAAYVN
jgi:hypothetical protein